MQLSDLCVLHILLDNKLQLQLQQQKRRKIVELHPE